MRYGRNISTFLSNTTVENNSVQQSEGDEPDPTSKLDSTCLRFDQNFAFRDQIQSETNQLNTTKKNFSQTYLVYEITCSISKLQSFKILLRNILTFCESIQSVN